MRWTVDKLTDLATAYWDAAALGAAVELGVFEALGGKGATAEEVARATGANPEHLARLLDALVALRVLVRRSSRYRPDPGVAPLLSRSSPTCLLDALRFNTHMYPIWGRLAECVRSGGPAAAPEEHLGGNPELTRRFVLTMHSRALAMAPAVLPALHVMGHRRLLDLASGPGTFSRLLAERITGLEVTLFDLPPVLEIARELTAGSPAADRVRFHPGDYRKDPLPGGFDAVLFCGALHQEDPSTAAPLLRAIHDALTPRGTLTIVDMMLAADRGGPKFSALFSLNMMLTSRNGRVFDEIELSDLARKAGFPELSVERLENSPYWILRASRR